jgi:pyruvate kinase
VVLARIHTKRTKIVATIGPSSWDEDKIRRLIQLGMDVARINFSHGDKERHGQSIDLIRQIAEEEKRVIAILADIQGPKIRVGAIKNPITLVKGDRLTLTLNEADGSNNVVRLPHPEFVRDLKPGLRLLLDDGNLEFMIVDLVPNGLVCEVVLGGVLSSRKGVMAPNAHLTLSAITDKDREDIEFALSKDVDYIAMSFVRSADDIRELRWLMRHLGKDAGVIAKIEKHEALENIEEIINVCEGIMVARGDLGVETPAEEVPFHQKRIIKLCNKASKPVITATQMLSSMVASPRPTRAEASDVYNAIIDGTDAVMLSNESASGQYPLESVETMATIAAIAEQSIWQNRPATWSQHNAVNTNTSGETVSDAISEATYYISEAINPRAIVTVTQSGYTARRVACERPRAPIVCVTPNPVAYRQMALVWGVIPILIPNFNNTDEMLDVVSQYMVQEGYALRGETVVVIAGVPFGGVNQTNFLKIHTIEA